MCNTTERKCKGCGQQIQIDMDNISDVVYYKTCYYHESCFTDLATLRVQKKRKGWQSWQEALDNMPEFELAAKEKLEFPYVRDSFNEYLIDNYNVIAPPDRIWTVIGDLANGIYKKKKCKPVSLKMLFEAWKWGQQKLNKINRNNKMNHKGPKTDGERILYDLAILVRHLPEFFAHKAKIDSMQEEASRELKSVRIDYNNVQKMEDKDCGLDDISSLLDEI